MITDFFINLFTTLLNWISGQIPNGDPFGSAGTNWTMWQTMDYFIPVHELLGLFATVFALGGPMAVVTLLVWFVVGVLRGGSTRA